MKPYLYSKSDGYQGGSKSIEGLLPVLLTLRIRGAVGDAIPDMYSLHHLHLLCRFVPFLNSWISGVALLPIGLCLNMAKG